MMRPARLIALVGDIFKLSELDEGGSFASAAEDVDLRALCEEIPGSSVPGCPGPCSDLLGHR